MKSVEPDFSEIGPYRLVELLGEGGMGEVWLAEQIEPVRRHVALKLIKRGMDSKRVVARFEAERQALALMDHPTIAKIYEAGASPDGRPYFVMEHVPGPPITEYCNRHRLDTGARLKLFRQVCEGIQHAHQKAVIHRDLKPSNILVTLVDGRPFPKIIDFGVAKAIAQNLSDSSLHTQVGALVGTPAYASPEQARLTVEGIDTRTDVYALGVVLYELLTGVLPFDPRELRGAGLEAMVRIICEEEPPRPSTRVSEVDPTSVDSAARRHSDLSSLRRELAGDLDWITMKALEKDRTRRYPSPLELAADIERYQRNEPILARPPTAAYRTRKFVRRHTGPVVAGALGVLALAAFGITMGILRQDAEEAKAAAEARARELEQVTEFQASMLGNIDPSLMGAGLYSDVLHRVAEGLAAEGMTSEEVVMTANDFEPLLRRANPTDVSLGVLDKHVLRPAVATIEADFADQPLVQAALRHSVARTYLAVGLPDPAVALQESAFELRRRELGADDPLTLESQLQWSRVLEATREYERALSVGQDALDRSRRVGGERNPLTLAALDQVGFVTRSVGDLEEARSLLEAAREGRRRVLGHDAPETLDTTTRLGHVLMNMDRLDEALPLCLEALEGSARVRGEEHRETLLAANNVGGLLQQLGRYEEAVAHYRRALDGNRKVLGDDHEKTLTAMGNVASVLQSKGDLEEARKYSREALDRRRRTLGVQHPSTLISLNNMGTLYEDLGLYSEALAHCQESLDGFRRLAGDRHVGTLRVLRNTARMQRKLGNVDLAVERMENAEEDARSVYTDAIAYRLGGFLRDLAEARVAAGAFESAESALRESLRVLEQHGKSERRTVQGFVELYEAWDAATPGAGHAATAAEWRTRLAHLTE